MEWSNMTKQRELQGVIPNPKHEEGKCDKSLRGWLSPAAVVVIHLEAGRNYY